MEEDKIVQIMPDLNGVKAVYAVDTSKDGLYKEQVLCLALTKSGDILFLTSDRRGLVGDVTDCGNFLGLEFKDDRDREWAKELMSYKRRAKR